MKAIYKPGSTRIRTTVMNGRCAYTGYIRGCRDLTVEEYLKELEPGYVCIPFDEAMEQANQALEIKYIGPWKEIDEKTWMDALGMLPPAGWRRADGVEFFYMSELLVSDIACFYAAYQGKYFKSYRRVATAYEALAKEIKDVLLQM